ncbi:MAG: NAD-binding protein [Verrucomicrobiales bacterium]
MLQYYDVTIGIRPTHATSPRPSRAIPDTLRHLRLCGWLLISLVAFGTIGFLIADQDHSLFHSFCLTLVVLTTVGMEPAEGNEKVVAVALMIGGIFTTLYAAGTLVSFIVDGKLAVYLSLKKLKKAISKLSGHYIVVGFGRMGRALCDELTEKGIPFVLIEGNADRVKMADAAGILVIHGNAHHEEVFEEAGIERARGLATCLPGDADNVYVTLTARGFSKELNIIARTEDEATHNKLIRAGADRVVCPPVLSAGKVMSMMVTPFVDHGEHCSVTDLSESIELFQIPVTEFPALIDVTLGEHHIRSRTGVTVVAVDRGEARDMNPSALFVPHRGDTLTLVGTPGGLAKMRTLYGQVSA